MNSCAFTYVCNHLCLLVYVCQHYYVGIHSRVLVCICTKDDDTHGNTLTFCIFCLLVMADLRGSDCLSVEECTAVFESYYQWEKRLVDKTAVKESDIIKKVVSIMDKHVPSRKQVVVLKGILKIDVLELCSFDLYVQIFTHQ